jgi:hypothetical protein
MEKPKDVFDVSIKKTGEKIQVYKLDTGTPTEEHVYCRFGGSIDKSCKETFKATELNF